MCPELVSLGGEIVRFGEVKNSLSLESRVFIGIHGVKVSQVDVRGEVSDCYSHDLQRRVYRHNIFQTTGMFSKINGFYLYSFRFLLCL